MRIVLAAALVVSCLAPQHATADETQTSAAASWGNSGAADEPVKDAIRNKYWWWPTKPTSNLRDGELWGNRGTVYGDWRKPIDTSRHKAPPPPSPPPPRSTGWHQPIGEVVLFDVGQAVLKPQGKEQINRVIRWLNSYVEHYPKDTVFVEGHTCDLGSERANMGLGQRRADAVKEYMVEAGIDAKRITTKTFGETHPAVANDSERNRKLNRRACIKVHLSD